MILKLLSSAAVIIAFAGCADHSDAEVTRVPKEPAVDVAVAPPPPSPVAPMADRSSMAGQTLPEGAVNQSDANPQWQVPAEWETLPAGSMRRASFRADGPEGPLDISVTSFPGDVGGLLANVNRWRGQVGLPPVDAATLEDSIERRDINGKDAVVTILRSSPQSMAVAIFSHAGNSWFFRMAGPTASVDAQLDNFNQYIGGIRFE
jgi:hypothetical protein